MKRAAGILALVLVVSLLGTSDVRGFALAPAGKTTGASLTATIVIDVTDSTTGGLASIRVQKSTTSTAALFTAGTIKNTLDGCSLIPGFDLQGTVAARYTGLISTLIDTPEVLTSLFVQFGDPQKA